MAILKCKMCGGDLQIIEGQTVCVCESCGTKQTVPRLDSERKAILYGRANHFRRNNEFEKAMSYYEDIVKEDPFDAESYWSIVLCRYGIEYVEDPATHHRVPTVNRVQPTSILADMDYQSALKYADAQQRFVYESEAHAINELQKEILSIAAEKDPYDVFLCYKETDENGERTIDSVKAQEIYERLTDEGFRVFYSLISLEDKLGKQYEPVIFAALKSAKIMIVIASCAGYVNAPWVRNEWGRFLAMMKTDRKKELIPAYFGMDPHDLPEEFSHLQAQDMGKVGFMPDLIRGVNKLLEADRSRETARETAALQRSAAAPLLKRAFLFLEDGDWNSANAYCEKVLDLEPENAEAYLGKLMAELRVRTRDGLKDVPQPFNDRNDFQKAIRFGDKTLQEKLGNDIAYIRNRNETARKEQIYQIALRHEVAGRLAEASKLFRSIPGWRDADERLVACEKTVEAQQEPDQEAKPELPETKGEQGHKARLLLRLVLAFLAVAALIGIVIVLIFAVKRNSGSKEASDALPPAAATEEPFIAMTSELTPEPTETPAPTPVSLEELAYLDAVDWYDAGQYARAAIGFGKLGNYRDAREKSFACWDRVAVRETIADSGYYSFGLKKDGTVVQTEYTGDPENLKSPCDASDWEGIIALSGRAGNIVGLRSDGTVVATGGNGYGQCEVSDWKNIVAIATGGVSTYGLRADGTVVTTGNNDMISDWTDIVAVAVGKYHAFALKRDGTVVGEKYVSYRSGESEFEKWTDIVAIAAGGECIVGLRSDGTVLAAGSNEYHQCDVAEWTDIVAISVGSDFTAGLRSDGTVVISGGTSNPAFYQNALDWTDIVAISANWYNMLGLKSDGTVVSMGIKGNGKYNVSDWTDIMIPQH